MAFLVPTPVSLLQALQVARQFLLQQATGLSSPSSNEGKQPAVQVSPEDVRVSPVTSPSPGRAGLQLWDSANPCHLRGWSTPGVKCSGNLQRFLSWEVFFVCVGKGKGLGWGGHCVSPRFGTGRHRVSQGWSIPGSMLGAVRVARGWKRGKNPLGLESRPVQRPSWDGDLRHWQENRVWVGTSCSCRDGNLAFAPLLCQGKGAENGQERGEIWREGEAGRSKAQAMGSDNLNSCAEGLSLQAN